ncbi:hypothetical protein BIZ37_04020 [Photobacterium sp. BZF1]|uniref:hypothetical protein n=1 Tax=Photobacterium sp. BZF1 TaxID=1904457 RepID=UPI00165382CC|nr:hypothetical protein [Photobacterium sp. BZF1]MBC7001716.1 hypothetical protein [Photobacterium sp. BZF1]
MKILYFDARSLFYSHCYINSSQTIKESFEAWCTTTLKTPLSSVPPDPESISRISDAAQKAGLLLYPLGTRYTRRELISERVFHRDALAPDIKLAFRVRMDDSDPIRRMLAHANALGAEWYVCGDTGSKELLTQYPERYLESKFGEGVTNELVRKILSL